MKVFAVSVVFDNALITCTKEVMLSSELVN